MVLFLVTLSDPLGGFPKVDFKGAIFFNIQQLENGNR